MTFLACDGWAVGRRGGADTLIYVDDTDGAGAGSWFAAPPRAVLFTAESRTRDRKRSLQSLRIRYDTSTLYALVVISD